MKGVGNIVWVVVVETGRMGCFSKKCSVLSQVDAVVVGNVDVTI
jgi:hypothetical protein